MCASRRGGSLAANVFAAIAKESVMQCASLSRCRVNVEADRELSGARARCAADGKRSRGSGIAPQRTWIERTDITHL
jgi:hypothetical protein